MTAPLANGVAGILPSKKQVQIVELNVTNAMAFDPLIGADGADAIVVREPQQFAPAFLTRLETQGHHLLIPYRDSVQPVADRRADTSSFMTVALALAALALGFLSAPIVLMPMLDIGYVSSRAI